MRVKVNTCSVCTRPGHLWECAGCPDRKDVYIMACDACHKRKDTLYVYNGTELCRECLVKTLLAEDVIDIKEANYDNI